MPSDAPTGLPPVSAIPPAPPAGAPGAPRPVMPIVVTGGSGGRGAGRWWLVALAIVVAGLLIGAAVLVANQERDGESAEAGRPTKVSTTGERATTTTEAARERTDEEVVRNAKLAVWRVETEGCGVEASGTAWAIGDRQLVTNAHVVAHDPTPDIRSQSGQVVPALVVGISEDPDIAILAVGIDLPTVLDWASTDDLEEGEHVIGLGYPVPGTDFSASPGSVVSFQTEGGERVAIRTDAALDHGDSGGPLMTMDGKVAGVITELADNETGVQVVPLAYTSSTLKDEVASMLDHPAQAETDCSWVEGVTGYVPDEPSVTPTMPDIPTPTFPEEPSVACPTGRPSVSVTEVTATEFDPEYLPGYWDVIVRGTVTNNASAAVDVIGVDVSIPGSDYPTYGITDSYTIEPGGSTSFEATTSIDSTSKPTSATASLSTWSWDDFDYYECSTS